MTTVSVGDKAPGLELPTDGGGRGEFEEFKGKPMVLYFDPKDMMPGSTTGAQKFRDLRPAFDKASAVVVGVSKDSVKRHDNFKTKYNLNFTLLSDADGSLCEDYGVWV